MSQIDDIKKSLSNMDDKELHSLLNEVRQSRRITKKASYTKKATAPKSTSMEAQINALSQEDKDKLLAQLLKGD